MSNRTQQRNPDHPLAAEIAVLITQAQRDPRSFAPLYDLYVLPVYRYLYSRGLNAQEADDVAAQTFLSALEALPRYREKGHFAAWLFSIARSKLMDHFRSNKKEAVLSDVPGSAEAPDPLADIINTQEIQRLSALILALEDRDQELIRLRYAAELPFAEMAVLLGKTEAAVKKALYRLLAVLQAQVEMDNE